MNGKFLEHKCFHTQNVLLFFENNQVITASHTKTLTNEMAINKRFNMIGSFLNQVHLWKPQAPERSCEEKNLLRLLALHRIDHLRKQSL